MIQTTLMILNQEFSSKSSDHLNGEMCTLVTCQAPRTPKPGDYVLKNKPCCCICGAILNNFFFILLCKIICYGDDVSFL
jgi:hypothetical protein